MGYLKFNKATVERLHKEGRGTGELSAYQPWLRIGEVPSRGRTHDPFSEKCGRPHQLLSDNERDFFAMLEWARDVVDIREQYPLPNDLTMEVAMQIGAKHPFYPGTHESTVMTVDFMVSRARDGKVVQEAYDVKETADIEDAHTLSKLEISRAVLERSGIPHQLVLSTLIPQRKVENIWWMRGAKLRPDEQEPYPGFFEEKLAYMAHDLSTCDFDGSLDQYCAHFDSQAGLPGGTSLRLARILMHRRILAIDLNVDQIPRTHMSAFHLTAMPGQLRSMPSGARG